MISEKGRLPRNSEMDYLSPIRESAGTAKSNPAAYFFFFLAATRYFPQFSQM